MKRVPQLVQTGKKVRRLSEPNERRSTLSMRRLASNCSRR